MLQFVLGNVGFGRGVETTEDGGGNCVAGFGLGEKVARRFTEGSANLQEGKESFENFGVGLNMGEEMHSVRGWGRASEIFLTTLRARYWRLVKMIV